MAAELHPRMQLVNLVHSIHKINLDPEKWGLGGYLSFREGSSTWTLDSTSHESFPDTSSPCRNSGSWRVPFKDISNDIVANVMKCQRWDSDGLEPQEEKRQKTKTCVFVFAVKEKSVIIQQPELTKCYSMDIFSHIMHSWTRSIDFWNKSNYI